MFAHDIRQNTRFALVWIVGLVVIIALSGCLGKQLGVDNAVRAIDDAIYAIQYESSDWQRELEKLSRIMIDEGRSGLRNEVNQLLQATVQAGGIEARCSGRFARDLAVEQLQRIKASLTGESVTLNPAVCMSSNPEINLQMIREGRLTSVTLDGYNLNPRNIQIVLLDSNNQEFDVTGRNVAGGDYQVVINLSGNGIQLGADSKQLSVRSGGYELYGMIITASRQQQYMLDPNSRYDHQGGGSGGGGASTLACGSGYVAVGLLGRSGDFIDQVGLLCGYLESNGEITDVNPTGRVGGNQSLEFQLSCPSDMMLKAIKGRSGMYVDQLSIFCSSADGKKSSNNGPVGGNGGSPFDSICTDSYVITALHLRSGDFIDQIIPICTEVVTN